MGILLFVGYGGDDGSIGTIDPATDQRVSCADSRPEATLKGFQVEASGTSIYVNAVDAGNVVESIDICRRAFACGSIFQVVSRLQKGTGV
jgi:hypothetical protein